MNHRRSALWLVSSIAALACNNSSSGGSPASNASASVVAMVASSAPAPSATASEKPRGPERGPGHGGVDAVFFNAARDLQLSDVQKSKVAALEGQLRDRETEPRDAMKAFASDLAGQIKAGKIDASKLQPDEAAIDTAMKAMLDKQATALAGLHDALDAGQRKALADAIRAKSAARDAEAKAHDGGVSDWSARRLERMTNDLGLDAGQQKQVGALLAKQPGMAAMHDDMNKQMDAILTAFQADAFEASKALQATIKAPHDAMDRQIAFMGQILPLLHADQRDKLAASSAKGGGRRGPGGMSSDDDEGHGGGGSGD
jgi:hypothetical protein